MTYKEILDREDTNGGTVVLYREGMFLKAYEHSAYLCHRYIHPFKLSRRFVKTVNRYVVSLGFPEQSLRKWFYAYPVTKESDKVLTVPFDHSVEEVDYCNWLEMASVVANPGDRYTPRTSLIENTPVYKTAYDLLMQCLDLARNTSKPLWDPYALKLKHLTYQITWLVRTLYDIPDRSSQVDAIQAACRELSFVLQVLKDRREISLEQYASASERTVSISSQTEGLRRTAKAQVCGDPLIQQPTAP